jgi:hypothetical protein
MQGLALSSPFNYYINTESMVSHWLLIPYEGLTFSYLWSNLRDFWQNSFKYTNVKSNLL